MSLVSSSLTFDKRRPLLNPSNHNLPAPSCLLAPSILCLTLSGRPRHAYLPSLGGVSAAAYGRCTNPSPSNLHRSHSQMSRPHGTLIAVMQEPFACTVGVWLPEVRSAPDLLSSSLIPISLSQRITYSSHTVISDLPLPILLASWASSGIS